MTNIFFSLYRFENNSFRWERKMNILIKDIFSVKMFQTRSQFFERFGFLRLEINDCLIVKRLKSTIEIND